MSRCHAVTLPCVAPAAGAPLLPGRLLCAARARPHWTPAQPAPAPAWPHQRGFFRSSYKLVYVYVYTQTIHSSASVCGVLGVCMESCPSLPAIVCYLCQYLGGHGAVGGSGQQWAAAHRKLETILCDICPSLRRPSRSRWSHAAADCRTVMSSYHPPIPL